MAKSTMNVGGGLFSVKDAEKLSAPVTKEEKESVNVRISKKTRQLLKTYCSENGLLMGDYVAKLIEDDLRKHGKM